MIKIFQNKNQLNSVVKTLRQFMRLNRIKSIGLKNSGVKLNYKDSKCKYITYEELEKMLNER